MDFGCYCDVLTVGTFGDDVGGGGCFSVQAHVFATAEECEKIRRFAEPSNEENFDRLERELHRMQG